MKAFFIISIFSLLVGKAFAQQDSSKKFVGNGNFYFSWGYNKEWYSKSSIHIKQEDLGNDFTLHQAEAHDQIGWDKAFSRPLTVPQYNYRIGYYFNQKQNLALEINFDHTKFVVTQGQNARWVGTINHQKVDFRAITNDTSFFYKLNNGANFLCFNIVRKFTNYKSKNGNIEFSTILKAGAGPVIPHVENTILGNSNDPHFQFGGWNAALESTFRLLFFKHVYIELCQKGDYASYSNLKIYKGTSQHHFFTFELIGNLGLNFKLGK